LGTISYGSEIFSFFVGLLLVDKGREILMSVCVFYKSFKSQVETCDMIWQCRCGVQVIKIVHVALSRGLPLVKYQLN